MAAIRERAQRDKIDCRVVEGDEVELRLWEIAENLHRAEHIAEWIKLTSSRQQISAQVAPKLRQKGAGQGVGGGRAESGINAAVRQLGIDRTEAQRAVKIASIVPEAYSRRFRRLSSNVANIPTDSAKEYQYSRRR